MIHRIFLALNLPFKIKDELLQYQNNWPDLPASWTKPDNLHVTLIFLGNTSDQELKEIQRITRGIVSKHQPFSFSLSKIVYGPTQKLPKMIWAIGEMPKELLSLKKDISTALNYKEDHPFSLHVTLARLREWDFRKIEPEERPQIQEKISFEVPVSSFEIMESKLERGRVKYAIVQSFSL